MSARGRSVKMNSEASRRDAVIEADENVAMLKVTGTLLDNNG